MRFDNLNIIGCLFKKQTRANDCPLPISSPSTGGGGDDGDPTVETLVLKPSAATIEVGKSIQFRTFLVSGTREIEVTHGLTYRSGDQGIAIIGVIGGNASGVTAGITTISVEYAGQFAYSQLSVISSCAALRINTVLLFDVSKSMGQGMDIYGTKEDFAKTLGRNYVTESNLAKDPVSVVTFDVAGNVVLSDSQSLPDLTAAINGIAPTENSTDIGAGFQAAVSEVNTIAQPGERKVIVIFSDGVNKGSDPSSTARQFKAAGGVVIVVAIRAAGDAFNLLKKIATDGFFLSAHRATGADTITLFSGLRAYLCSCTPKGDQTLSTPQLNYNHFNQWNVSSGVVDLIGDGGEIQQYDFLPGHGLYVDLVGSSAPWLGSLESKTAFTLINGRQYQLSYKLAGNQRLDMPGFRVGITVGTVFGVERVLDDWKQDFTTFTDVITGNGGSHKITFRQSNRPPEAQSFGNLLDDVKLVDTVTGLTVFQDQFDSENPVYYPPGCGAPANPQSGAGNQSMYGYYGYYCYSPECPSSPPPAQREDPAPPNDIELPVPPPLYTATASYTAVAVSPYSGADVTRSATATSTISQEDAYEKALAEATSAAFTAGYLIWTTAFTVGKLFNIMVRFPSSDVPRDPDKEGYAGLGLSATDFWNYIIGRSIGFKASDGSNIDARSNITMRFGGIQSGSYNHPDILMRKGVAHQFNEPFVFYLLPAGTYDIYVYGHGWVYWQTGKYHVRTGKLTNNAQSDPIINEALPVNDYGISTTSGDINQADNPVWTDYYQYTPFRNVVIDANHDCLEIYSLIHAVPPSGGPSQGGGHFNCSPSGCSDEGTISGIQIYRKS